MSKGHTATAARMILRTGSVCLLLAAFALAFFYPDTTWTGVVTLVCLTLLGVLFLRGVALSPGVHKCSALTGVTFACVYLLIVFTGFLFSPLWNRLPTSKALAHCYAATYGEIGQEADPFDAIAFDSSGSPVFESGELEEEREIPIWPQDYEFIIGIGMEHRYVSFARTGHFAFALIFTLLGMGVGYVWNGEPRVASKAKPTDAGQDESGRFDDVN